MNPDFVDLLRAFIAADVRFVVVGAYALAIHGRPNDVNETAHRVGLTFAGAASCVRAPASISLITARFPSWQATS